MTNTTPNNAAPRRLAPVVIVGLATLLLVAFLLLNRVTHREPGLSEDQARYLQDVEHLGGFVFGDRCLPRVSAALRDGNLDELMTFLSARFNGGWIFETGHPESVHAHGQVTSTRRQHEDNGTGKSNCNGKEFIEWLLEQRGGFESLDLSLIHI